MISGIIFLLIIFLLEPKCLFKTFFHVPCSMCGMTRAFKYILNCDILNAIKANLLCIPLFINIIIFIVLYLLNIFFDKIYVYKYCDYFIKRYKTLIIIFIINWVVNIVKILYY